MSIKSVEDKLLQNEHIHKNLQYVQIFVQAFGKHRVIAVYSCNTKAVYQEPHTSWKSPRDY